MGGVVAQSARTLAGRSAGAAGVQCLRPRRRPLAGVSLEAALRCAPGHRMAGMLDQALQSGLRPERIRELALTGYRLAARLGVRLPRRAFGRRAV
ncbi:hypothetical protein I552_5271 [Mycobacterium xenopi 3993]|nr:hypothetical protein I552_5271 [Mycobacterium xenopi 3993]